MIKNEFDIRDIACDGWGFTAETSGMNRFASKYLEKVKVELKEKVDHSQDKQKGRDSSANRV